MEKLNDANTAPVQGKQSVLLKREIRLDLLFRTIIRHWKTYIVPMLLTAILTSLYMLGVPRYYSVSVMLAPETSGGGSGGGSGLGSLASMAGINLSNLNSSDAIIPTFYPDLMSSTDFIVPIFNTKVQTLDGKFEGPLVQYYTQNMKPTPMGAVMGWVKNLLPKKDDGGLSVGKDGKYAPNPFKLSKTETELYKAISSAITCNVDKKTDVVSISVTMQDPLVAAQMADTLLSKLQGFITQYRTKKAKNDLSYYQKLCESAQLNYEAKQREYADYVDANQDVVLATYKVKEENLENEMQLAYDNYSQLKKQVQLAEAKVTERTPAFTVIQNASVPIKHAGPKRVFTVAAMLALCFLAVTVWIIAKDKDLAF